MSNPFDDDDDEYDPSAGADQTEQPKQPQQQHQKLVVASKVQLVNHQQQQQTTTAVAAATPAVSSTTINSSILGHNNHHHQLPFRILHEALAGSSVRAVCSYGPLLFGSARSSSATGADCPLYCWDIRRLAANASVNIEKAQAAAAASKAAGPTVVQGPGEFLFHDDLFERERGGERQSFPCERLCVLAPPFSAAATASNLRFVAASSGPTFKVCSFDRTKDMMAARAEYNRVVEEKRERIQQQKQKQAGAADEGRKKKRGGQNDLPPAPTPVTVLCESPSGELGSPNPLAHKGHCGAVTSLTAAGCNGSQVLSGSSDGTIRLWSISDEKSAAAASSSVGEESIDSSTSSSSSSYLTCTYSARHGVTGQIARTARISAGVSPVAPSTVFFTAGHEDGRVMLWDSRTKFIESMPARQFVAGGGGGQQKLKNVVPLLSAASAAPLLVCRGSSSLSCFDLRGTTTVGSVFPAVQQLPVASDDAAPLCIGYDEATSSPTAIFSFDADPDADFPQETVGIVSLADGRMLHRAPVFAGSNSGGLSVNDITSASAGYVALACSDCCVRFCATDKTRSGSPWWTALAGTAASASSAGTAGAVRRGRD